jgi:predicted GNAT family acetyltransferase
MAGAVVHWSSVSSIPDPEPRISVVDDPERSRYELRVDGTVAGQLVYEADGTRRTLIHTEIDPAFEGQGLGSHLAAGALDDARRRGFTVVPRCPFVTAYLRHHHEHLDVVEEPYRSRLGAG